MATRIYTGLTTWVLADWSEQLPASQDLLRQLEEAQNNGQAEELRSLAASYGAKATDDTAVREAIAEMVARGTIIAFRDDDHVHEPPPVRQIVGRIVEELETAPGIVESLRPTRTFVEIRLSDEEGTPVSRARYVVRTKDGDRLTGRLDVNGFARQDGISPDECYVTFPDYDEEAWEPS